MSNNMGQKIATIGKNIGIGIAVLLIFASFIAVPTFGLYLYDHGLPAPVRHITDTILNAVANFYLWGTIAIAVAMIVIGAVRKRRA